jgi:hypothetical protein
MKRLTAALATATVLAAFPATAAENIDRINALVQTEFRQLSEDLGSTLSYKAVTPAVSLGILGVDFGVEVTATKLEHRGAWDRASSGTAPITVYVPKFYVHKGLPLGFDVGAFYSSVPRTNISLWGAELRYALIDGGPATPALGLRGTYSKLSGINQLNFDTKGLELVISKGFANFTPYAGVGHVWVTSTPVGVSNITKEKFGQDKIFIGGNLNLAVLNLAIEADRTGNARSYTFKLGWRF